MQYRHQIITKAGCLKTTHPLCIQKFTKKNCKCTAGCKNKKCSCHSQGIECTNHSLSPRTHMLKHDLTNSSFRDNKNQTSPVQQRFEYSSSTHWMAIRYTHEWGKPSPEGFISSSWPPRHHSAGYNHQHKIPAGEYVQFFHVNGNHWITLSNIGENSKSVLMVCDSLLQKPNVSTLQDI